MTNGWIPGTRPGTLDVVLYDGGCGLCHRLTRFLIAEDADGSRFRYAALGGETFRALVPESERASLPDSVVVVLPDGKLLVRSDAALHVADRLGGLWRAIAAIVRLLPRSVRDVAYDGIAHVRFRLFAKPDGACPVVPAALRQRFLP